MNKRYLVLIATGCAFATIFAAGCAAQKRVKPATSVPVIISSASTQVTATRVRMTEATTQKVVTVFREAQTEATTEETETEATTTTAKPTAKPTNKPTAKPTKKPTAKPTKKPTAKPTAKATVKANTLAAAPKNDTNTQANANQLTGIYNGAWSQVTVDATNVNNVKLTVTIHDQEDPNKTSVWKMGGKLNTSTGTLVYSNCTKTNFQYDENGSVVSKDVAYSNGQGKVVISNGMITWNDYQEHAADDMTFVSAAQHDHRG